MLDISYFACVGVLAMGLSAAAFIEAIAAARRREEELLVDLQGRCPVTGLSRDAIERRGGSFDYWVGAKHNALHYIFLVLHLRAKAARGEPFSSLEATIARTVAKSEHDAWERERSPRRRWYHEAVSACTAASRTLDRVLMSLNDGATGGGRSTAS